MQEKWIGRSEGAYMSFPIAGRDGDIEVYTTRHDTIFGATFLALAANHPLALELAESFPDLAGFIVECNRLGTSEAALETAEKKGFDTGLKARHPFLEDRELPVYVANFVLMEYGTGAIFGCPGHDQRDLDFARKYALDVIAVVAPGGDQDFTIGEVAYVGDGAMINFGFYRRARRGGSQEGRRRQARGNRPWAPGGELPAPRLGHLKAALLGVSNPGHPLPRLRHRGRAC